MGGSSAPAGCGVCVVVPGPHRFGAGSGVVLGQGAQRPVPGDLLQHGQRAAVVTFSSRIRVWRSWWSVQPVVAVNTSAPAPGDGAETGCAEAQAARSTAVKSTSFSTGLNASGWCVNSSIAQGRATPATRSGHADHSPACPRSGNWTPQRCSRVHCDRHPEMARAGQTGGGSGSSMAPGRPLPGVSGWGAPQPDVSRTP